MATRKTTSKASKTPASKPKPSPRKTKTATPEPDKTSATNPSLPTAKASTHVARRAANGQGGDILRKGILIDEVMRRTGLKKRDVKPTVETVLAVLGETIAEGRTMQLPPLGTIKRTRSIDRSDARVSVVKLRQKRPKRSDP